MANEKRLIDANALEHKMFYVEDKQGGHGWVIALEDLSKAPTVDAVEVVHGRWIKGLVLQTDISTLYDYTCSECSIISYRVSNYCPNCGAKMRERKCDET